MADTSSTREILCAEALSDIPHGFLTGIGHEGEPDPGLIVPGGRLVLAKQVHSNRALAVSGSFASDARREIDALVTATPGLVLGIVTADCAPILLADREAGVIAAAHAGWRGAHQGVLENTVLEMEALGASRSAISAAIGPTIAQANYEVGADMRKQFDDADDRFFEEATPGKWRFDLPAYVRWRLESLGIGDVEDLAVDTYAEESRFHSFRRATHRNEPSEGRQFSLIGLAN